MDTRYTKNNIIINTTAHQISRGLNSLIKFKIIFHIDFVNYKVYFFCYLYHIIAL
ncbi:MAG: hypothetical protein WCG25_03755 [bacterium]